MALSQRRTRLVARLRSRKSREREGLVLVEGVRAVSEALDAGAHLRFAVTSPRLESTPEGPRLLGRLLASGVEIDAVSDAEIEASADTAHPQGVLLVCTQPAPGTDAVRASGRYLAMDGVQDPGNVGTLVRSAAAFGLDGVVALEGSADPWGAKAVRASAGTVFRMAVLGVRWGDLLARGRAAGLSILGAHAAGEDPRSISTLGGWVLVVGNEGAGLREEVLEHARARIGIPMTRGTDSLNAGVAGSILLYELTRARDDGTP